MQNQLNRLLRLVFIFSLSLPLAVHAQLGNLQNQAADAKAAADKAKADADKAAAEAKAKADQLASQAGGAAANAFREAAKDIQFMQNSANLQLDNPKYQVNGMNLDAFMKNTLLPALKKLDKVLPAGQRIHIIGHANRLGSEEQSGSFIGNIELSRLRAKAVEKYLRDESGIKASRFKIISKGSSSPVSGVSPGDEKNCRVSFDVGN